MLIDVLTRVCEDTGYHATQERSKVIKLLNAAAREMYQELDCNRIKREVSCLVGRNKIVALPSMIGELLGMRQHSSEVIIPLESMTPRYASNTLSYKWKNWRDLGESPVHTLPASTDTLTFTAPLLESAVVSVSGQTNNANSESESVTISASPTDTTKLWVPSGIKSITSVSTRTCDIAVEDADGNEVAVLYNNERRTRYRMVDVSELFWGTDSSDGDTIVDILYKEPLYYFTNDTDSFPAGDIYDEAWHARAMSLYYSPMAGRREDANRYRMISLNLLRNIKDGSEQGIIKKLEFGRNKYMTRAYYAGAFRQNAGTWQEEPYNEY